MTIIDAHFTPMPFSIALIDAFSLIFIVVITLILRQRRRCWHAAAMLLRFAAVTLILMHACAVRSREAGKDAI